MPLPGGLKECLGSASRVAFRLRTRTPSHRLSSKLPPVAQLLFENRLLVQRLLGKVELFGYPVA
jgi:hypothetical protein